MSERLRRDSPVPLYHQLAMALRNRIAVGELEAGARLPSVRAAAAEWQVNLHTVRHAYQELEREGLLRVDGNRGTTVAQGATPAAEPGDLDAFLGRCAAEAVARFGLARAELGRLLIGGLPEAPSPVVHVIECSREQAAGHCAELRRAWTVDARPLVLGEATALPGGTLIGTFFHYNDIRQRWPERLAEVQFLPIAPDPALAERIPTGRSQLRLVVCELDEAKALNIAADLRPMFPAPRFHLAARVLAAPGRLPRRRAAERLLVSPRVWAALSEEQRAAVQPIEYRIRGDHLSRLGRDNGWRPAARAGAA